MITEEESIRRIEEYIFYNIENIILENKCMFRINESESENLHHNSVSKCFETNMNRLFIKNLDNINEPIYVSNQSDSIINHEIPDEILTNIFYDIDEEDKNEYIQRYKRIYINIDAKGVKNDDEDSKLERLHFSNSQTSIENFYGIRKNNGGTPYNASGKQKTFINNKLNLTFLIKGVWSYDIKYKYDKIHLYCIPNGLYYKNIELISGAKNYPRNINQIFEIRMKTEQLPDNYYLEILI
jgi:hypothetical protein